MTTRYPEHDDTTPTVEYDGGWWVVVDGPGDRSTHRNVAGFVLSAPKDMPAAAAIDRLRAALAATPDTPGGNPYRPHVPADVEAEPPHDIWNDGYAAGLAAGRAATGDTPGKWWCWVCGERGAGRYADHWQACRRAAGDHPAEPERPGPGDRVTVGDGNAVGTVLPVDTYEVRWDEGDVSLVAAADLRLVPGEPPTPEGGT